MKHILIITLFLTVSGRVCAQTADPFREMEDAFNRMRQWQQQLMEQGFGNAYTFPGGDSSSFYFHIDTTFSGSFDFSPFDQNGMGNSFFDEADAFFRQFFGESPLGQNRGQQPRVQGDDGNTPPEDGLLPEERLRQEQPAPSKSPSKLTNKNTIRI
jgi:hypothetical protein